MTDLELLARTRAVLAEVATWEEARGRALEATGLVSFADRADWLLAHPVSEFEGWRLREVMAEIRAARAAGFRVGSRAVGYRRRRRPRLESLSVPKPRRRTVFTARQLEIAIAALDAQEARP